MIPYVVQIYCLSLLLPAIERIEVQEGGGKGSISGLQYMSP